MGRRRERSEWSRAVRERAGMWSVCSRWRIRGERVGGGQERRFVKMDSKAL